MTAAAVAVKVAVVAPDCTKIESGTVRAEVKLLESDTVVPAAGADWESVTLQVVEADAARLVVPHCRDVTEIGEVAAVMEKATEALDAPTEAVTVAF